MQQRKCPYCSSTSVELIETSHFRCKNCGLTWWIEHALQEPQIQEQSPAPQLLVTRKTSTGRLLGHTIYHRTEENRETESGLDTSTIRDFAQSQGLYLIHDDSEIEGTCSSKNCGGLVHKKEATRCSYHSSNELLCSRHTYSYSDKKMCFRGYFLSIATAIILFPFKVVFQILGLVFLKD